mgnify:CR=1 FL=1
MKIAIFDATDDDIKYFSESSSIEFDFYSSCISNYVSSLLEKSDYEIISVFVTSTITKDILKAFPNAKYIQTRSAGYDNLKIELLKPLSILSSNVAQYAKHSVSEFAFSLLLNVSRKTSIALNRVESLNYDYLDLKGFELANKKCSVIGTGDIGSNIVKIAHGFGMDIKAYSRTKKDDLVNNFKIQYVELEDALKSDIIFISTNLNEETFHLINTSNINILNNNAIVINIGRGEIISNEAIVESLNSSERYFGIDVIENECEFKECNCSKSIASIIKKSPKVFHTPHMAYYTEEALLKLKKVSLENIELFCDNKDILNRLT